MSLSTKILVIIAAAILVSLSVFLVWKHFDDASQMSFMQKSVVEQKQLLDNISRAQSQYASKQDIDAFAKQQHISLDVIAQNLDSLHAKIEGINAITVISSGQSVTNIPSTTTKPGTDAPPIDPAKDTFGYMTKTQVLDLHENLGQLQVPVGNVGFSAWRKDPWELNIQERQYHITTVLGQDEDGRHYTYSKFAIETGGKRYEAKIDKNEFKEEMPQAKFSWWNPQLLATGGGSVNLTSSPVSGSANVGAVLGVMSYGKTKPTPQLSIAQVGIGYQAQTKRPAVIINPINLNIGSMVGTSVIRNTYVGPSVQFDTAGTVSVGANISVGF